MNDLYYGEIIIKETGEIGDGLVLTQPENYVVIHKESVAKKRDYLVQRRNADAFSSLAGRFTFTLATTIKELNLDKRFTQAEKSRIMFLGSYVNYKEKGSFLMFDNGRYILKKHLQDLLEIKNRKEFYQFYNKLVNTKIIMEDVQDKKNTKLIWSKKYHFRGTVTKTLQKELNLIKTFDKQVRVLYKEKLDNGKAEHTPHNLYYLFMLLPYVHLQANIICKYPDREINESVPFTVTELAKELGFKRSNDLKRKLFGITLKGLPVFSTIQNAYLFHILVNPFIVRRSRKSPSEDLLFHFKDTAERLSSKTR